VHTPRNIVVTGGNAVHTYNIHTYIHTYSTLFWGTIKPHVAYSFNSVIERRIRALLRNTFDHLFSIIGIALNPKNGATGNMMLARATLPPQLAMSYSSHQRLSSTTFLLSSAQ
jgi:hypothetical protein